MNWIKNIALSLSSTIAFLFLLEILLWPLPVNDVSRNRALPQDAKPLDVSSRPNGIIQTSTDWNFKNARDRKVNNYGFFSDYDYVRGHRGPVVIGDSYVEAIQVDFGGSFHQSIAERLGTVLYNFGISGAPLSQYEAYLAHICEEFQPTRVIIPVIDNDFDESLYEQRKRDGFFHYRADGNLQASPYEITPLRDLANRSSLAKYLYFNLHVGARISELMHSKESRLSGESDENVNGGSFTMQERAARLFLDRLRRYCVPAERILLVLDADRNALTGIYSPQPERSRIYATFAREAKMAGYRVLDLQPLMLLHYQRHKKRFEFPFDRHWNAAGHRFVADSIVASGFFDLP